MKININQFQALSKGMDTSLKKNLDHQEVGFEELILQMMSMVDMEIPQELEVPELDEERVLQETLEQMVQDVSSHTKSVNNNPENPVLNGEYILRGCLENHLVSEISINKINDRVEPHKSTQITVEDIKIESDKNINRELDKSQEKVHNTKTSNKATLNPLNQSMENIIEDVNIEMSHDTGSEVEVKTNLLEKQKEHTAEKPYIKENHELLKNKTVGKVLETMTDKNQGQEVQNQEIEDTKIELNKTPKENIKPMAEESYKKQDIEMPINESEVEKHTGHRTPIEDKKNHKSTEKDHDISREKPHGKDLSIDGLTVLAPIQPQNVEKVELQSKQIHIKNFEEITNEMVKEIKVLKEGEKSSLTMKLKPKELGEIEIKLEIKTGQVLGKIVVENSTVKGALESQFSQLKDNLNKQDIRLQDIEITIQQNTPEQHQQQERKQDFFNQGNKGEKRYPEQIVEEQAMESAIDSPKYYRHSVSNTYYNSQRSSLNLLA